MLPPLYLSEMPIPKVLSTEVILMEISNVVPVRSYFKAFCSDKIRACENDSAMEKIVIASEPA